MLCDIPIGRRHVTSHHTRNGLLSKIVIEEGVYFLSIGCCLRINRGWRYIKRQRDTIILLDADIVNAEPCPTGSDNDGVIAFIHKESTNGCLCSPLGRESTVTAVHGKVHHLVAMKSVIAHIDDIFPFFRLIVGKGDFGIFFCYFQCFPTRILAILNQFAIHVISIFCL